MLGKAIQYNVELLIWFKEQVHFALSLYMGLDLWCLGGNLGRSEIEGKIG